MRLASASEEPSLNSLFLGPLPSYAGMTMQVVEAGTKITDERTGKSEVVTDGGAVMCDGKTMYMTKPTFERLKKEFPIR